MKLAKRESSGREKDEASIELLEQLREKLYLDNTSAARHAAFQLSWMQEDGFEILKEALLSDSPKRAKTAATYGLRNMRGRMKKLTLELFQQGLQNPDADIIEACKKALEQIRQKTHREPPAKVQPREKNFNIRELPPKKKRKARRKPSPGWNSSGNRRKGRPRVSHINPKRPV